MGFDDIRVVLWPHQPVYFSGQTLQGFVILRARQPITCRSVKVVASGRAKVEWNETQNKSHRYYHNEEHFMMEEVVVWHSRDGVDEHPAGTTQYPFSFVIPPDQPSSFEGKLGNVRYSVKALVDIPRWPDQKAKTPFSVNYIYDLNEDMIARRPLAGQKEAAAKCCGCRRGGPISMTVLARKRGYVPGENIVINAEITNNSGRRIESTEAKLVQFIIFYSNEGKINLHSETLERVHGEAIEDGCTDEWRGVRLRVPACTPTELRHCRCIDVRYGLTMKVKLDCCLSFQMDHDIVIGNIPLRKPQTSRGGNTERGVLEATSLDQPPPNLGQPPESLNQPPESLNQPPESLNQPPPNLDLPPPQYSQIVLPDAYMDLPPPSFDSCVVSQRESRKWRQHSTKTQDRVASDNDDGFTPNYLHYNLHNEPYSTTTFHVTTHDGRHWNYSDSEREVLNF